MNSAIFAVVDFGNDIRDVVKLVPISITVIIKRFDIVKLSSHLSLLRSDLNLFP